MTTAKLPDSLTMKPQPGSHLDDVLSFVNRQSVKPANPKPQRPAPKPVAQPSGKVKAVSEKLAKTQRPGDQLRAAIHSKQ